MQDTLNMWLIMWLQCWRVDGSTPTYEKEERWASVANLSGRDAPSVFKRSSAHPLREISPTSFLNFPLDAAFIQRASQWKESSRGALWYWAHCPPPHDTENSAGVQLHLHHPQQPEGMMEATRACNSQEHRENGPAVGLQSPCVALCTIKSIACAHPSISHKYWS